MAANPPASGPPSARDDRVCVNCGKRVNPDRKRVCNHCGLPFRGAAEGGPANDEPDLAGLQLLKIVATLAFVLPPLGPLASLRGDQGTLLGFASLVIAGLAAVALAWWRPLPGGILVALAGSVPFIVELVLDASGTRDPSSRYWLFWFFPGGLVGGGLFVAAAFWRAPTPPEEAGRAAAEPPARVGLVERARREALGLAALATAGLIFVAVMASYPPDTTELLPNAILVGGFPLLLVGAGALGYREGRARGSFASGLVAAVVAILGIAVGLAIAGRMPIQVGEGEWIGEAFLAAGLAIAGGGFFGLAGGGLAALLGGMRGVPHRGTRRSA